MPPLDSTSAPGAARARYRRLPGRTPVFRLASNAASLLWLGDDHLLQVNTVHYSERYKRFAYGDIQAFLLRETSRGLVYSSILGTFTAGCGLLAWSIDDADGRWFFVGLGVFWLVLLIVNLLRGKTCRCQLQTASGPHLLRSLSRVRPARKALRIIMERVEAAQGTLAPDDAARQMDSRAR